MTLNVDLSFAGNIHTVAVVMGGNESVVEVIFKCTSYFKFKC